MFISQGYIDATYEEKNNSKHEIRVFNKTKNLDVTEYLEDESLDISRFLENETQSISPNTLSLTFVVPDIDKSSEKEIVLFTDSDKKFTDYDCLFTDFKDSYKANIISENDELIIYDMFESIELALFTGIVMQPVLRREHLRSYIKIELKDKTIKGYTKRFDKDYIFQGYYFYKSDAKDFSLLYQLAKDLGFADSEIDIEEIKYTQGDYVKIPVARFEKDKKLMEELAELVRAVAGSIWVTRDGVLKITSLINQTDTNIVNYEFKQGNILTFLETNVERKETNKVEVSFTENKTDARQAIFILAGQNADYESDDAKVKVPANTATNDTYWEIKYLTDYVTNIEQNPEVSVYKANADGTKTYFPYTAFDLVLEQDGGKVKFLNPNNFDIFIEKFKIYGEPVKIYEGNKVSYTEKVLQEHEIELYSLENKYIQDMRLAQQVARYLYFQNCRDKTIYKMIVNSVPFLELQDVVKLDFEGVFKAVQITKISQRENQIELEVSEFEIYVPDSSHFENQKSNLFDERYINNSYVEYGKITYPTDKPPAPINLVPTSMHLGVEARWDKLNRDDVQEYIVYLKGITEEGIYTGLNTTFSRGNSNHFLANLDPGFYELKVSAVTLAGIESEQSAAAIARSLKIDGSQLNVDGDTITVDLANNKLVLGTVYAANMSANSILANHIKSGEIEAKHLKANTITTDKILFGAGDAIQKNAGGGIEIRTLNGNALNVVGMMNIFNGAGLTVFNGATDALSTLKTVILGGKISYYERSP